MVAEWTPPPSAVAEATKKQDATGNLSTFLDIQLNKIFGPSFAPVVEFETNRVLGSTLYEAFKARPTQAVGVLVKIFRREEAVNIIIDRLTERLLTQSSPQSMELLGIFQQLRPILVHERCG